MFRELLRDERFISYKNYYAAAMNFSEYFIHYKTSVATA
jgi:hypothetical protein